MNTGINFDNYDNIPVETSGENSPLPITSFDECSFASILQENVKVRVKYVHVCIYISRSCNCVCAISCWTPGGAYNSIWIARYLPINDFLFILRTG